MNCFTRTFAAFCAALILLLVPPPAAATEAPYDKQLMRLAEVLGSVHFLRRLCGEESGTWREQMEALLEAEAPTDERRAQFVASFNHGYRSYANIYTQCTDQAVAAIERYMAEGEKLANDIVLRYGN
ncbi:TIGR02301 family protein [Nitratireductor luteus]|uniref:TIGR02301 family protein n=1 Tax=Nitratireductor luteus TaxID=2976980 RepID=UPI00224071D4|nr:TIGR02301 family protein [Nitratireductor luteus]